jgi:multicomponent Na+:H+ antiporter subunit E
MKSRLAFFFLAFLTWCLLNWVPDVQHLIVGAVAAAFVAWLTGDLFVKRPEVLGQLRRYWSFLFLYVPVLLWEIVKANLDVSYRVIHPALPIKPGIVKVTTRLKTDIGLTVLANSITLTPGTLCVDIDRGSGVLYVHWLNVTAQDVEGATARIVARFERLIKKVFE